ncbi:hypothetical protein LIER_37854 [Lithospermum erythrorhizon]|uniref:Cystatin domain-containing protein n=1 Tax=Lithospermum erythrorhizon TaxID=34254 RepID=A0AAV3PWK6_LITER
MEPSRTPIVITLSLFVALFFIVNVEAIRKEPEPFPEQKFKVKGVDKSFKLANANDPLVVNAAKFACDEHNKKAGNKGRHWEFVNVLKAKTSDVGADDKKIALIISANDGPLGDFPQALVEVNHNVQKSIAFKEPPEEY